MSQPGVERRSGSRTDLPPPTVTQEQSEAVAREIGAKNLSDQNVNGAEKLVKERKAKIEMRIQYDEIYKALDRKVAEFVIDNKGRFPSMNEARTIFSDMQEFLNGVDFFEKDLLAESVKRGEPFLDTGKKIEFKLHDKDMVEGRVVAFDLVVEGGKFKLWSHDRGDTEEGVLEKRIIARG